MTRAELVEDLKWKKFPVLNDGFICLVDVMGDDAAVVQAARVSYGKDRRQFDNEFGDPDGLDETQISDAVEKSDRKLLRYLMRHRHTTPLEMAEVKFLVRVPMDCWRQWIRHRTANVNEYSTRYTEAIDEKQTTQPDRWRLQSDQNKQGSGGYLDEETGNALSVMEKRFHEEATYLYKERLRAGVAREQARKDLPLCTYTESYWKCDLHNILHFLGLRMDSHAQKEIRDYATIMGEQIIKPLFPMVWEAFQDYHPNMGGLLLSRLDIEAIKLQSEVYNMPMMDSSYASRSGHFKAELEKLISDKRERSECIAKLERLDLM